MDADMNMSDPEPAPAMPPPSEPHIQSQQVPDGFQGMASSAPSASTSNVFQAPLSTQDRFREVSVKVHVRKPEKDTWAYIGRGVVTHEAFGQGSRIVVRALSSHKVIAAFSEGAPVQAEKRGNFVVVSCVDAGRVVAWSLNALNNSETLRLLAIIELSCYTCKHTITNPDLLTTHRKRIARIVKDDRRKRHKRRKDQDAMIDAFAKTDLADVDGPDS